jgi:hypothetical protein
MHDELSAQMITTAITVGSNGSIVPNAGATYGILVAILIFHGVVCSAATRILARLNLFYVVMNGDPLPSSFTQNISLLENFTQLGRASRPLSFYLSAQGQSGPQRMMHSPCMRTTPDGPTVSTSYSYFHYI